MYSALLDSPSRVRYGAIDSELDLEELKEKQAISRINIPFTTLPICLAKGVFGGKQDKNISVRFVAGFATWTISVPVNATGISLIFSVSCIAYANE